MYPSHHVYRAQLQVLTLVLYGLHITALTDIAQNRQHGPQQSLIVKNHALEYKSSTTDSVHSITQTYKAGSTISVDQRLAVSMTNFYEKLSTNQVSLGSEINKVVHASLWDLYLD